MSVRDKIVRQLDDLDEAMQREVYDFVLFLRLRAKEEAPDGLLLSESTLARDWNTPEEDAAWANL